MKEDPSQQPSSLHEEMERQRELATASHLMSVLDYLFFNLAHELGNPINSIKMTLDVLINNFDSYTQQTRLEYLNSLQAEFRRLEELLKAIRSFNTYEHLAIKATDIQALVQNLLQMLQSEIGAGNIRLSVSFPDPPLWAAGDPQALHQALLNVIGNAIDALAGHEAPSLAIAVERDHAFCRIRISDNGCGIPADKEKEVFLPFFSTKPQGIGLGLLMVMKLLTRMNGRVEISRLEPRGTEVRLILPVANRHGT